MEGCRSKNKQTHTFWKAGT